MPGVLATAPWRRAPVLLARRPVVIAAIVVATAILAIAAASAPLFLSTVGTASLAAQAAQSCPEDAQPTITALARGAAVAAALPAGGRALRAVGLPGASAVADGHTSVGTSLVHLFARQGALDHVTTLTPRTGASGVWLPNTFATKLRVGAGDTITTATGVSLPVAGVYRDMAPNPFALSHLPRYWCTYSSQIVATVASDAAVAATPIVRRYGVWAIADVASVRKAADGAVLLSWSAPMSAGRTALSRFATAPHLAHSAAQRLAKIDPALRRAHVDRALSALVAKATASRSGMTGSVLPIALAGVIVAALLVGGAGLFWAFARRREIDLLVARGVGPAALAAKAVLETAPAGVAGSVVGLIASMALVRDVGPSPVLESGTSLRAAGLAFAALVLALLLIAAIGAHAGRDRSRGRRSSWLARVPWELGLLVAAGAALATRGATAVEVDHTVVQISPGDLFLPLLGAAAALALLGRVVGLVLGGAGRAARNAPVPVYLALRRMSRSRAVVVAVLIGIALPCCLQSYASTVSRTISEEVARKYQTDLGAPHVLQIYGVDNRLFDASGTGTQVVLYNQDVTVAGEEGVVLGVDPATFSRFAFTDAAQRAAVGKLHVTEGGSPVPAIVVNAGAAQRSPQQNRSMQNSSVQIGSVRISATTIRLDPVASMTVFPGLRRNTAPMIVVPERVLQRVDSDGTRTNQLWTDAAHYAAARERAAALGFSVLFETSSTVVIDATGLLPITWIFGYLRALAVLIGVVAIAGLVFGLAARTRRQRIAYVLGRRMGLSRRVHLVSLLLELGVVVGLAWLAGSGLGLGSFRLVVDGFDVYPSLSPAATLVVPRVTLAVTLAAAGVVVVLAAVATQALADRTRPAEILRLE